MFESTSGVPATNLEGWDVSGLQPEARDIAGSIVEICTDELGADLLTLLFHGSAVKGGILKGSSDIDFVMIMQTNTLTDGNELPLDHAIALYRRLATINLGSFRYLQGYACTRDRPPGVGFIPDAYAVAFGSHDVPHATDQQLLDGAAKALAKLAGLGLRDQLSGALLKPGTDPLYRQLRFLCTDIWPMVAHVSCLAENDGITPWQRTKFENVAILEKDPIVGVPLRTWNTAITHHYAIGESVESGLVAIRAGFDFLDAAAEWYEAYRTVDSEPGHA
jgi:predicted nucleotidyltransferase